MLWPKIMGVQGGIAWRKRVRPLIHHKSKYRLIFFSVLYIRGSALKKGDFLEWPRLSSILWAVKLLTNFFSKTPSLQKPTPFQIVLGSRGEGCPEPRLDKNGDGTQHGWRRVWWLMVENISDKTVQEVRASIDDIIPHPLEIPDAGLPIAPADNRSVLPLPQRLKLGSEGTADFVKLQHRERVRLNFVSYCNASFLSQKCEIQLEGSERRFFAVEGQKYVMRITLTGDDVFAGEKLLEVTRIGEEITVSLH